MSIKNPVVVQAHSTPRRLHRSDCWHSYGPYRAATDEEKRTLPDCYHCARVESGEAGT